MKAQNKPTKKDSEKLYVKYNQRFQVDCKKLNALIVASKSGTKAERAEKIKKREEMRASVMKSYDIPKRTLDKHLDKPFPGLRDKREDAGTEKVILPKIVDKLVTESMLAGKSKGDAVKIASEKIGKKISGHKALTIKTTVQISESSFGVDMKKLVGMIWELDNIAPGAYLPIDVISKGKKFTFELHFEALKNIQAILSNEFNKSVEDRFKVIADNEQIREIMVGELFEEQIRIAREKSDLKAVGALVNMQKQLKVKDTVLSPNFKVAYESAKIFKPDLTKQEFIAAIRLMSKGVSDNA